MAGGNSVDNDVDELLSNKVDDLVKFNVVTYLYRNPAVFADAEFFAQELGFHSAEQTKVSLDELVSAGVLEKESVPKNGGEIYGLRPDPRLMQLLAKLTQMDTRMSQYSDILTRLATRSLVRAGIAAGMIMT
ncbi:MAG: hypothetical protein M1305_03515 [Candidatus Marsarchaeota archaeon]|nr:hypothetical protein [Candidatus Marsarchaeota archaeon]